MGVLGLEAFPPQPYLDSFAEYDPPHGIFELASYVSVGHGSPGHLALAVACRDDSLMLRRRRRPRATLDDVVEYLRGMATVLMEIDAKLDRITRRNEGDEDEEEEEGL